MGCLHHIMQKICISKFRSWRRFDQSDICMIREIENLLLESANGTYTYVLPRDIVNFIVGNVDIERLQIQLPMLPDLIKTTLEGTIKKVKMSEL